ncbi:MAG TPA: hypothetical protein VGB23_08125 [Nitrospirota bacterium]|jgi:nickel transport protein
MNRIKQSALSFIIAVAVVVISASSAHAHKVSVFAHAEDGKVHAECYFVDGTRCTGSKVTVEDSKGAVVSEGVTDSQGMYVFDIPKADSLKIVLHAGMGHLNDYTLGVDEVKAAYKGNNSSPSKEKTKTAVKRTADVKERRVKAQQAEKAAAPRSACADTGAIKAAVDEAVEARLQPMYKMLSDMRDEASRPKLTDAIGGIGYIMGIMGIIMYFKSRKA